MEVVSKGRQMHTEVQTEKPVEKYLERPKGWTDKKDIRCEERE